MKNLENQIIDDIRNIVLGEDLEDLKENSRIDAYFLNKLNVLKTFKEFEMSEITEKYIKLFEEAINKISSENFSEKDFEMFKIGLKCFHFRFTIMQKRR